MKGEAGSTGGEQLPEAVKGACYANSLWIWQKVGLGSAGFSDKGLTVNDR